MSDQTPARRSGVSALGWVLTIVCNIVAPILTYNQLTGHGCNDFTALLVSAGWPVLDLLINIAWKRRLDEFAVISLIFVALTMAVTLVGPHSARLLLVKDSLVTGLFGVLCLITLAAPRPLMFYFGRKFATDGSAEALERWNGLWVHESFRTVQRNLTLVWGVAYLAEAALRVGLSYALSTGGMVTLNSVLSYGVTAVLIGWTITYAKRARARGAAAQEAATAAVAG
ncbi:VC0807 family protein [Kitasatospora sp. NPDC056138]|uniref:VC0807 family protein n=1 Tax=Kitasatospora sp. NPDC056138 TaxID=3345724 RepID=UPI0035D772EB